MDAFPTLTREEALVIHGRGTWPVHVPQWTRPDGSNRFAILQALTPRQKIEAEDAATVKNKAGQWVVSDYLLMCEEVRRALRGDLAELPTSTLLGWNYEIVQYLYTKLQAVGGYVPSQIEAALARIVGDAAPPPTGGRADVHPQPMDTDAGDTAGGDDSQPDSPVDG